MSEESKDIAVAEKAAMDVFEAEDKEARKELVKLFLDKVLRNRRRVKAALVNVENQPSMIDSGVGWLDNSTKVQLGKLSSEKTARVLGTLIGTYEGVFEVMADKFEEWADQSVDVDDYEPIIQTTAVIANNLREAFGDKIHEKIIKKRLKKIARKHKGKLQKNAQKVLAKMAAQFA